MARFYDLTKPPKFVENFFSFFRKWKLTRYKKKKIRKEKASEDIAYFVKFMIKLDDSENPQEFNKHFQMIVPAKAAFFAKRKTLNSIKKKIRIEFIDCESMTDEEFEAFEKSKES